MAKHDKRVINDPCDYGYIEHLGGYKIETSSRGLEMLKVAFCLVLATWMAACLMTIVYSREIVGFIVEHTQ